MVSSERSQEAESENLQKSQLKGAKELKIYVKKRYSEISSFKNTLPF